MRMQGMLCVLCYPVSTRITRVCTGKGGVMHAWRLLLQVGVIGS